MTVTLRQNEINNNYVSLEVSGNTYTVQVCPIYSNGLCGYPTKENHYSSEKSAIATYNRYIRELR